MVARVLLPIWLTAIAIPAETAVELPCWPDASDIASPPAMAKMLDSSLAVTSASPRANVIRELLAEASVAPVMLFTETEPATATAVESPVPPLPALLPEALLPAPPAAAEITVPRASAAISSVGSASVGSLADAETALAVRTKSVSCANARVVALRPL